MKLYRLKYFLAIFFLLLSITITNAQWKELGGTKASTFNHSIRRITTDVKGNVFVVGDFKNGIGKYYVAKWNGTAWSELGGTNISSFNGTINCITTDAKGNVYAAGMFCKGDWPYGNYFVAIWNGKEWSQLGGNNDSTFNYNIYSITTDAAGSVYAGGMFNNSNNKCFIAKWNGSKWIKLIGINDGTFNSPILSITIDKHGNIYTCGNFTNDSDWKNTNFYVAKYSESR